MRTEDKEYRALLAKYNTGALEAAFGAETRVTVVRTLTYTDTAHNMDRWLALAMPIGENRPSATDPSATLHIAQAQPRIADSKP